ncbi:hypothetical protein [Chitinophaga vietnamensis]|uniref:hypothetical protein n=1 Tax=Chitinophaga vietnamensis TaxID=2593957 RepID=UPI0011788748|nr:hypothetical protein [Chitinophaga vietnamensis]
MPETFEKYIKTKKRLAYHYKGYHLEKILSVVIAKMVYKTNPFDMRQLGKGWCARDFSFLEKIEKKILFTIEPFRRKDYYEIWDYVQQKFEAREFGSYDLKDTGFIPVWGLRNLLFSFRHVFSRGKGISFRDKLMLVAEFAFVRNTIDHLEKQRTPVVNKYVAFCGVHYLENLLTQYFIKRRVPTYSLQHGVSYVFTRNIPFDAIAYENMISDYHICWGQYTKDEMYGYGIPAQRLLVGGYPRTIPVIQASGKGPLTRKAVVFLARSAFEGTNIRMLNILKKLSASHADIRFQIKLHPSLKEQHYANHISDSSGKLEILPSHITISELLSKKSFDFAIAVNTATYYESYIFHLPCFRFEDGTFDQSIGVADDLFTDNPSLERHLKTLYETGEQDGLSSQAAAQLTYAIGYNVDNYYRAIMHTEQFYKPAMTIH